MEQFSGDVTVSEKSLPCTVNNGWRPDCWQIICQVRF